VPSREPTRRSTPWLTLLALLSFAIAALIWGVSLAQSVERPSVGNALEQRQLELEVLASRQGDASRAAEEKLLTALQQSPEAGNSDSLIAQALLEQRLEQNEPARRHLGTVLQSGPEDLQPLAAALLEPEKQAGVLPPLPQRPLYRLLSCDALGRPSQDCVADNEIEQAQWRLSVLNLLPLFGVLFGIVLLLQLITEVVLVIAGGFVVLGGVVTPLLALPALGGLLAPLSLTPALRAATEVLILYTLSALPAVVVLALLLRGLPAGEARWLQWRASWLNWPQAGRGLLMSLPIVALSGWLVERFWPNAGGSNPLLEEVLNGRSSLALLMLAFTATVLAPLFEELLFRGVLLPVVGARWGIAAGIGVSALVFALAHLSLSEAPPLLALGIGLGWLRWSSGRLLSTVVMHGLWNGLTFFNLVLLGS